MPTMPDAGETMPGMNMETENTVDHQSGAETRADKEATAEEKYSWDEPSEQCTRTTTVHFYTPDNKKSNIVYDEDQPAEACCYWGKELPDDSLKMACPEAETTPTVL